MNTSDTPDDIEEFDLPEVLHADVYKELKHLAATHVDGWARDQTLQPTVLVHETWLRLAKHGHRWRDRRHSFATASITMRHILIDHARRKARLRHGGGSHRISWFALPEIAAPDRSDLFLLINEGIDELERANPERMQVVVNRFFGGMTNHEIAECLGISERGVERHWAMAKVWLLRWIQKTTETRTGAVA